MKKIFRYILMFIVMYIILNLLTYWFTVDTYKDLKDYKILTETPTIKVTECKSSYSKGHINGTIKNNSSELMKDIYIKVDLFNNKEEYLGTKYEKINLLNVSEENKFSLNFAYENVGKIEISVTNQKPEAEIHFTDEITETVDKYIPFIGIVTLIYLLP